MLAHWRAPEVQSSAPLGDSFFQHSFFLISVTKPFVRKRIIWV
jgi:hypothetical protein